MLGKGVKIRGGQGRGQSHRIGTNGDPTPACSQDPRIASYIDERTHRY